MPQKEEVFVPEKSEDAAQGIKNQLPLSMDAIDQFSMMAMAGLTMFMRMDPIALWILFFVLVSIAINKGSNGTILSQSFMSAIICFIAVILKYVQIMMGTLPPPAKWHF